MSTSLLLTLFVGIIIVSVTISATVHFRQKKAQELAATQRMFNNEISQLNALIPPLRRLQAPKTLHDALQVSLAKHLGQLASLGLADSASTRDQLTIIEKQEYQPNPAAYEKAQDAATMNAYQKAITLAEQQLSSLVKHGALQPDMLADLGEWLSIMHFEVEVDALIELGLRAEKESQRSSASKYLRSALTKVRVPPAFYKDRAAGKVDTIRSHLDRLEGTGTKDQEDADDSPPGGDTASPPLK